MSSSEETERDSFYFEIFGYLLEIKCGTWTEVQVCASDIRGEIGLCVCGHAFTLKREARIAASNPVKRKRALESMEDTLRRQENNKTHMASMRGSETKEQILERLEQNRTRMASMRASETAHEKLHKKRYNKEVMANARTRTVPVEGAIAAFHPEVKLASLYTIFRIAHHQCKMCWNKALTFGVGLIKVGFRAIVFMQCKDVFNPNVTIYISVKLHRGFAL